VAERLRGLTISDAVGRFLKCHFIEYLEQQRMAIEPISTSYLGGVQQFLRLVTMLEKALDNCKLKYARSYQKNRFGFYLKKPTHKAFLVYINYADPGVLRLSFCEAPWDKVKFVSLGTGQVKDGKASFEFNFRTQSPDFFTLPGQEQLDMLTSFLKNSYDKAVSCILTT
jgi:hypothetical protein